jgi:hypothetical protein
VRASLSSEEEYLVTVNRWGSSGLGPVSSNFGVISAAPLAWLRFEAVENDDSRGFACDMVQLDNVAVPFDPPQTCAAELELCEAELLVCLD